MTEELSSMSSSEKKDFLSNDLIERMIAVEQRVSAHFGELLHYTNTEYYKNLSLEEKKKFEKFLRNKEKMKLFWISLILSPLFILLITHLGITGSVVKVSSFDSGLNYIFLSSALGFLVLFFGKTILNRKRIERFNQHTLFLERLISKRYLNSSLFKSKRW